MPEDLRPIPRLPLDTAQTEITLSDDLNVFTVEEPGESIVQIAMIETRTPTYNASVAYAGAWNTPVSDVYPDVSTAIAVGAAPITNLWQYENPVPPQFPGETT